MANENSFDIMTILTLQFGISFGVLGLGMRHAEPGELKHRGTCIHKSGEVFRLTRHVHTAMTGSSLERGFPLCAVMSVLLTHESEVRDTFSQRVGLV